MRRNIRRFLNKRRIHPRRWFLGIVAYSRFIGYIRPQLSNVKAIEYRVWRKLLMDAWEPRELRHPVGKRILAISPHSDDEAIGAGGILWAHRDSSEIHVLLLTDGAAYGLSVEAEGSLEGQRAELIEARNEELLKSTKALDAKSVTFFELPDGGITIDEGEVSRLRSLLEEVKPDVVILPWFLDGHRDHRAANLLFAKACEDPNLLVLGYEIWTVLDPNAYFDISEHLVAKLDLIRNYESQLTAVDYVKFAQSLAQVRGYQLISKTGEKAAEAFVALPSVDYCSLVEEVLGD